MAIERSKIACEACHKRCSGNVLKVQDKYFHVDCFKCKQCRHSLSEGGFFVRDNDYYCSQDYQKLYGTKCAGCGRFVEGEVVTALGNTYHTSCFACARCRKPFPVGEKVTFTGTECVCRRCLDIPVAPGTPMGAGSGDQHDQSSLGPSQCAGCAREIQDGQALIALDQQWHIYCFKCAACGEILHGEYLGHDGRAYCERDYQRQFGVKCVHCERYITGKVLQAGENFHYHPTCARCTKCGDHFGDGEEMFMQAGAIWHPRCGPGPGEQSVLGSDSQPQQPQQQQQSQRPRYYSGMSGSQSRSISPFPESERSKSRTPTCYDREPLTMGDLSRFYTISYLTAEPTQGYLKRPVEPKPPKSPQFHRPRYTPCGRYPHQPDPFFKPPPKQGMQALVDNLRASTPRSRSPVMNNEEPIELSHYPDGRKPGPKDIPPIERDDFPAPPFPYTDPETRRRLSESSKEFDKDSAGGTDQTDGEQIDPDIEPLPEDDRLRKEEQELSKISTGIGKVFLASIKEREKVRAWKLSHVDPRSASRNPSAKSEIARRLRYDNPVFASPSRDLDRPKPWEEEELDSRFGPRLPIGPRAYMPPPVNYNIVSSLRSVPKPGYGLRSGRTSAGADSSYSSKGLQKTHSIDSDISIQSERPGSGRSGRSARMHMQNNINRSVSGFGNYRSTPFSESGIGGVGYRPASVSNFRQSMPNVNYHIHSNEPPTLYPYHLLSTTNYRLPPNVDRCHLERHLSNEEFEAVFHCNRIEFYKLPEWKRNDMKKRARLF